MSIIQYQNVKAAHPFGADQSLHVPMYLLRACSLVPSPHREACTQQRGGTGNEPTYIRSR